MDERSGAGRLRNGLRSERELRGWSQARAAEAAGISRQAYAAIESGRSVPSAEVALRLALAWGAPVERLFRLPEERPERVIAEWGGARGGRIPGRRVRLVSVAGRLVALPEDPGPRPGAPADGVVVGGGLPPAEVAGTPPAVETGGVSPAEVGVGGASLPVEVDLLRHRAPPADLAVVGCDPAFGIVAEVLRRERGVEVAWSLRGSRAALEALARGHAHVAGAHLHDPTAGPANERWIREIVPFPCTRITFAHWDEGLLVGPGNPHGIRGIADLARPRLRLVNRERGSGSRALLDEELERAGIPSSELEGYGTRARGHLAVAGAIAAGLAEAGVAIRAAGVAFGLAVVPLRSEAYELVVPDHYLDLPAVGALLEVLRRPGVREQVEALQGYDASRMGEPA